MSKIISGKEIGANERARIKADVEQLKSESGITPRLSVIIVGSDPASCVYVRNKHKSCIEVGMLSDVFELPENTTQEELEALMEKVNAEVEAQLSKEAIKEAKKAEKEAKKAAKKAK